MKWNEHLVQSNKSLVSQLTSRINGLSKVASRAPVATRFVIANGIFMSKLVYLIHLWGNSSKYLLKSLQILQNRAARVVKWYSWWTPVRRLLKDCKWLSINQLVFYHTTLQTHKSLISGKPHYFKQNFNTDHPYRTRQSTGGGIWRGKEDLISTGFSSRGAQAYNSFPPSIRGCRTIGTFKYKLQKWVATNIPID